MRWQLLWVARVALSPVPLSLRRRLQNLGGRACLNLGDEYPSKLRFLRRIQAQKLEIAGRSFLEIGTGWHPVLPILLALLGAERVVTIDMSPWLTRESLRETLRKLQQIGSRVAADLELADEDCRGRLERWAADAADPRTSVHDLLRAMRIEYACPVDARSTPFGDGDFDYVVSCNVLEHVPPQLIRGMADESRRILKPGGFHLHHVNPGDHFFHADRRITTANFLKFSPLAWRILGGWGVGYHNRLRCVDFGRIFAGFGFEVTYEEAHVDPGALHAIQTGLLRPHRTFGAYTADELAGSELDVFARLPISDA